MPYSHPLALRTRVVAHVEEGHAHWGTAEHFQISIKLVNDMVKLKCEASPLVGKGCVPVKPLKNLGKWKLDHAKKSC